MNALVQLSSLEQVYEQSWEEFEHVVGFLASREASAMTESEFEREIEKRCREVMRKLLQEHIDSRGPGESQQAVCGADGIDRSRVRLQERKNETIFGTVEQKRAGYGHPGVDSLHPLDAELNLAPERYSLELRRRVAIEAAKRSFDETLDTIRTTTGGHVQKRQLEELTVCAAQDFDEFYKRRHEEAIAGAASGEILVISVDGKGVVMRPEDLREPTRKAAEARKPKMGTRLSKGEKKNAKRMATVAAVYTISPFVRCAEDLVAGRGVDRQKDFRPRPEQKRVWASLEKEPKEVIDEAFQEALYRDPNQKKMWVALVDGNKEQLRIIRKLAKKKEVNLIIVVDLIHVIEYLWTS